MSVQLVLYPQAKLITNEFLVDGLNFTNIAAAYNTSSANPAQQGLCGYFLMVQQQVEREYIRNYQD